MGCGNSSAMGEVPSKGKAYSFEAKLNGMMSDTHVVTEAGGGAKLLMLKPSGKLTNSDFDLPGAVSVMGGGPGQPAAEIMKMNLGVLAGTHIPTVETEQVENLPWGLDTDTFADVKVVWTTNRTATMPNGLKLIGMFGGIAKAESDEDGDAETSAHCQFMKLTVEVGGQSYTVTHNWGNNMEGLAQQKPQAGVWEVAELGIKISENVFAGKTYKIDISDASEDPVQATLVAFCVARFFHPDVSQELMIKTAEDIHDRHADCDDGIDGIIY